jgi:hypothetical protein
MGRAVLLACVPWLAMLAASIFAAWALARFSRARLRLGRLRSLHGDEAGAAQTLAFVLTLPVFVWVLMLIVQISQLMIGTIVVHYAAFAAARAASVWIPAGLAGDDAEGENRISNLAPDPNATDQNFPTLDPSDPNYGSSQGEVTYLVSPGSPKYTKIASAAVLAVVPISPSKDYGFQASDQSSTLGTLIEAYQTLTPNSTTKTGLDKRLDHKLAYAASNTDVEIRIHHKNEELPLQVTWGLPDDPGQYYDNEIGWQDLIEVTVKYKLALLPGPATLLFHNVPGPAGYVDHTAESLKREGNVTYRLLEASATMGNEGQQSVIPYVYQLN